MKNYQNCPESKFEEDWNELEAKTVSRDKTYETNSSFHNSRRLIFKIVMIFKIIGKSVAVTQEDLSNCYYITLIFPDLHLLRQ